MLRSGSVLVFLYSIQTSLMSRLGGSLGLCVVGIGINGYSQSFGFRGAGTGPQSGRPIRGRQNIRTNKLPERLLLIGLWAPESVPEFIFFPSPRLRLSRRRVTPTDRGRRPRPRPSPPRPPRSRPTSSAPSPPPPARRRTLRRVRPVRSTAPWPSNCRRSSRQRGTRQTPAALANLPFVGPCVRLKGGSEARSQKPGARRRSCDEDVLHSSSTG